MTQKIDLKISSKHAGITLEDITIDQAQTLVKTIVGTKGPYKVTISWEDDGTGDTDPEPMLESEPEPAHMPEMLTVESTNHTSEQELEQEPEPKPPESITPVVEPASEQEPGPVENINEQPPVKLLSTLDEKINKIDFTTPQFTPLEANLHYGETEDGRLLIKYYATRIDTTWEDLTGLEQTVPNPMPRGIPLLANHDTGNRRSAVIKFIEHMRNKDIKQGRAIEILDELNHPAKEPETKEEKDPAVFKELDTISETELTEYININLFGMGYHDQGNGKIVICYDATKVYTSWGDMFKLPKFIDNELIEKLGNLKQVAIRQFRKWMADHPDLLPDGVDPDAEFRSAGVGSSVYPPTSPRGQDFGGLGEDLGLR